MYNCRKCNFEITEEDNVAIHFVYGQSVLCVSCYYKMCDDLHSMPKQWRRLFTAELDAIGDKFV